MPTTGTSIKTFNPLSMWDENRTKALIIKVESWQRQEIGRDVR
jgi:hypothetical protein